MSEKIKQDAVAVETADSKYTTWTTLQVTKNGQVKSASPLWAVLIKNMADSKDTKEAADDILARMADTPDSAKAQYVIDLTKKQTGEVRRFPLTGEQIVARAKAVVAVHAAKLPYTVIKEPKPTEKGGRKSKAAVLLDV